MMTSTQIRKAFLDFFASKGHTIVKSASVVPQNDPTLFFTSAGMVPFKNVFMGSEKRDYTRASTSQKCMRVSGKHNDLENVGRTARHHTFFEMLGNFSFGDYFKKEAIGFAWEFLTKVIGLPADKLWVTVFEKDDEAEELWQKVAGVPKNRIFRLGEKDNFWAAGDTGPCGPCSEIHYQFDSCPKGSGKEWFVEQSDAGGIMEIWNLVFMQYERDASGQMTPLPRPSIDTGMGLERLSAVLQGQESNYDSDLFVPLLHCVEELSGQDYDRDTELGVSMRVLADHIRATAFVIADGVLPSNEGRGYVLRRIMRRAIRHGKLLGLNEPFFYKMLPVLADLMAPAYPEIKKEQAAIEKVIRAEEERFLTTLDKGLGILEAEIKSHSKNKKRVLDGAVAFRLYDTFGFPLDLTEIIAAENEMSVDHSGFEREMDAQKDRARAGWKGSGEKSVSDVFLQIAAQGATEFIGYESLVADAKVAALVCDGLAVNSVDSGTCQVVFDRTPFYAEGGGQVGDRGKVTWAGGLAKVLDVKKPAGAVFVHTLEIESGALHVGDSVKLTVADDHRLPTMRNHSATHLMHAALRTRLGAHVRQAGSLVTDKILRFDFNHFEPVSPEVLRQIENDVNRAIWTDAEVSKKVMNYDQAVAAGALAFFGDKYGDEVRVIGMGTHSTELCGGTHVGRTGEIGYFRIVSEGGIAAGVRRIEAVTGAEAVRLAQDESDTIKRATALLKGSADELLSKIEKQQAQVKVLEKEIDRLKSEIRRGSSVDYLAKAFVIDGGQAVAYQADVADTKSLQETADVVMEKLGNGVSAVFAVIDGKVSLVVSVSRDLSAKFPASKVLQPLAELVGGRGGGKPERAQAGGADASRLDQMEPTLKKILT